MAIDLRKKSESLQRLFWADFTMNIHSKEPPHSCGFDSCGRHLFASLKLSALTKKAEPYGLVCGGLSESAAISMIHGRCTQVQRRLTPQRHSKFAASSIEPEPL